MRGERGQSLFGEWSQATGTSEQAGADRGDDVDAAREEVAGSEPDRVARAVTEHHQSAARCDELERRPPDRAAHPIQGGCHAALSEGGASSSVLG